MRGGAPLDFLEFRRFAERHEIDIVPLAAAFRRAGQTFASPEGAEAVAFAGFLEASEKAPIRDGRRIVGPVWFAYARGQLTGLEVLERLGLGAAA